MASHRVFTGPDGREYKWLLNAAGPEVNCIIYVVLLLSLRRYQLRLNNGSKTVVARYHSDTFRKSRGAYLDISPAGERIVDMILVTFIYIERLRKDE